MFANMFQALFLAVVFIYLILASQFGSFIHPLAIMLSLPLSLVGVALALLATSRHAEHHEHDRPHHAHGPGHQERDPARGLHEPGARREGLARDEALIKAGSTRLRPIVMTTLAMIFGMMPLAFALGAGAEMRAPMARAVIGGLITSTLLTLVVVPVVYTYLDDLRPALLRDWLRRLRFRRRRAEDRSSLELLPPTSAPASRPASTGSDAEERSRSAESAENTPRQSGDDPWRGFRSPGRRGGVMLHCVPPISSRCAASRTFSVCMSQLALGELGPQRPLERARNLLVIEHLDLLDEPVYAEPDRRVADPVGQRQLLEGARGHDEPLQEGEILLAEHLDPALRRGGHSALKVI